MICQFSLYFTKCNSHKKIRSRVTKTRLGVIGLFLGNGGDGNDFFEAPQCAEAKERPRVESEHQVGGLNNCAATRSYGSVARSKAPTRGRHKREKEGRKEAHIFRPPFPFVQSVAWKQSWNQLLEIT